MAVFAAVFTLPLLFVGGSVTTYRVGLAVPGLAEHVRDQHVPLRLLERPLRRAGRAHPSALWRGGGPGHDRAGAPGSWLFEPRRWMKGLGVVALVAVIVQGVLGGTRVTQVSTFLAAVHGCTGQAFFGLMVALCVLTGRDWQTPSQPATDAARLRPLGADHARPGLLSDRAGGLAAALRHAPGAGPARRLRTCGLFPWLSCSATGCGDIGRTVPWLVPSALCLALAVTLQVVLGLAAFVLLLPFDGMPHAVGFYQAVIRTGHQTNGALLLAASVVFALRALHHLRAAAGDGEAVSPQLAATPFGDGPLRRTWRSSLENGGFVRSSRDCWPTARRRLLPRLVASGRVFLAHEAADRADGPGHRGRRLLAGRPRERPPRDAVPHAAGNGPGGRGAPARSTSGWSERETRGCAGRPTGPCPRAKLTSAEAAAFGVALGRRRDG